MDIGDNNTKEVCVHHGARKEVCHFAVRHGSFKHDMQLRVCSLLAVIESGFEKQKRFHQECNFWIFG